MTDPSLRDDIRKAIDEVARADEARIKIAPQLSAGPAPETVRFLVTKIAIGVWATFVVLLALFIIFGGNYATPEKMASLLEILKVGILPIVTFAIGHYFGSRSG
jgi:hypothetical protein